MEPLLSSQVGHSYTGPGSLTHLQGSPQPLLWAGLLRPFNCFGGEQKHLESLGIGPSKIAGEEQMYQRQSLARDGTSR